MDIPLLGLAVPKMWVYLIGNVLTQYPLLSYNCIYVL